MRLCEQQWPRTNTSRQTIAWSPPESSGKSCAKNWRRSKRRHRVQAFVQEDGRGQVNARRLARTTGLAARSRRVKRDLSLGCSFPGGSAPFAWLPEVGAQLAGAHTLAATVVELAERGLERLQQLVGSAVHREVDALGLVRHGHRLDTRDARLEHAPDVVGPGLAAAVVVAQVGFHPSDLLTESAHRGGHRGFDIVLQVA